MTLGRMGFAHKDLDKVKPLLRNFFAILVAVGAGILAHSFLVAQPVEVPPYNFQLGEDVTAAAKEKGTAIKPKLRAVADDRFEYEFFLNTKRKLQASAGGDVQGAGARNETWMATATVQLKEDEVEGNKDLRAKFNYDSMQFLFNDGIQSFSGYIGKTEGDGPSKREAAFTSILSSGERTSAANIPGWPGVTASEIERHRATQANDVAGNVSFNVSEMGKIHSETYYADFESPDPKNHPARFLDPVQLMMYTWPEFAPDASAKVGETLVVRRRFAVGVITGQTVEYEFTYKVEKVYGKAEEPTAALLSFTARPAKAGDVSERVRGLDTNITPPEIKDGTLLLDLVKGVAANVRFTFSAQGRIGDPAGAGSANFAADAEFSAALRKQKDQK